MVDYAKKNLIHIMWHLNVGEHYSKGILSRPKISGLGRPLLRHTEHAQKRLEIGSTSKFAIRRPVRLIQ